MAETCPLTQKPVQNNDIPTQAPCDMPSQDVIDNACGGNKPKG
jgi:hypothetical protein